MIATSDTRQLSLLAPDEALLVHLLRENTRLLRELVTRREVGRFAPPGDTPAIRAPEDLATYLGPEMADLAQEQLRVVSLDSKNRILGVHLICQGGLNTAVIRLADCFREAIRTNAAAVIFVHNHPSRDPAPSPDDRRLTQLAGRLGDELGIDLVDHLIIGGDRHVSLRRLGLYTPPGHEPAMAPSSAPTTPQEPQAEGGNTDAPAPFAARR